MAGRKRIAFLIENIFETYHSNTWPGAVRAARELGYDLFILPGAEPATPDKNDRQHTIIYTFMQTFPVDGFIIASNTFGTDNTQRDLQEFIRPFMSIPHVCIGSPIGDAPVITVGQKAGLIHALEHLIHVHGKRNFAYIRGPVGHPEADVRYKTFLQTLGKHHIPFNESFLYTGDFLPGSGVQAIKELVKERQKEFDAVVAANDLMAIAALNALEEYGIHVPADVAVLGFDDMKECRFTKAPLTTVSQPLAIMTSEAVRILDQIINDVPVTRPLLLSTKAVIRRSCGCFSSAIQNIGTSQVTVSARAAEDPSLFSRLVAEKYMEGSQARAEKIKEISTLILTSSQKETFSRELLQTLDNILVQELNDFNDITVWNDIFNEIFIHYSGHFTKTEILNNAVLKEKVRVSIGEKIERRQVMISMRSINEFQNIHEILRQLSKALSKDDIAAIINTQLPVCGIAGFFLILYDQPATWEEGEDWQFPGESRLLAGFIEGGKKSLTDTAPFPTTELLKPQWLRDNLPGTFVIHPLFFETTHMGYIVARMGPENGLMYESIRAQLSNSLLSSRLFSENEEKEKTAIKKSERIQSVILPMLDSIKHVTGVTTANIESISRLVEQTEQNSTKLHTANESVDLIAKNVEEIINLINSIDDISQHINLLSINASIQSARAGVHGKGFAIIAMEVRKLADTTASIAKQTAGTLNQVVKNIQQSQSTSRESVESFQNLKKDISVVSSSLTEISGKMAILAQSSQEIFELMK